MMSRIDAHSILIVDGAMHSAFHLQARLLPAGCTVDVVATLGAAVMTAHREHLDLVFPEHSETFATRALGAPLAGPDVPYIFTANERDGAAARLPFVDHLSKMEDVAELRIM
jgi:hypothetical protein